MSRTIHMAAKVAPDGSISPACAMEPRPVAPNAWTLDASAVTCRACRAALADLARTPAPVASERPAAGREAA